MGIADELEKLEELHRKGTLSDEEFERAKASVLGTVSHSSQATKAAKETDSSLLKPTESRVKSSAPSKFLRNLIILAIFVGIAWFFFTRTVGKQGTERMISTVVHTPITLIDEIENINASSWKAIPLNLTYSGSLNLSVEVIRGNPVDIVVIHSSEIENYKAGNQFRHFSSFEASKTKSYKRSGGLNEGIYYLVIRDNTLGILSSATSDIKITARLEP